MSWRVLSVCIYALCTSVLMEWGFCCCCLKRLPSSLTLCASTLLVQNESNRAFKHVQTRTVGKYIRYMILIWLAFTLFILSVVGSVHCANRVINSHIIYIFFHTVLLFWAGDLLLIFSCHLGLNIFYCAVFCDTTFILCWSVGVSTALFAVFTWQLFFSYTAIWLNTFNTRKSS